MRYIVPASSSLTKMAEVQACGSESGNQKRHNQLRWAIVQRSTAYRDSRGALRLSAVGRAVGNLRQRKS